MSRNIAPFMLLMASFLVACGQPETPVAGSERQGERDLLPTPAEPPPATPAALSTEDVLEQRLVGYEAPSLDGSTFRISDQKGKVVLLNAWATWCGPCRYEIPELKRLHEEYADDGLVIAGVSIDMGAAEPVVREFVKVNAITYPILLDPQSRVTTMLRTTSIPASVMIDREGNIVWRHVGIVSEQRDAGFRKALAKALGI